MSSATQPLSFDELPRGAGGVGASEQIAKTLTEQGLNATVGLYDEALALARDGHLARAAERLRMVLVLDPNDAEAAVLLGKVQAGRGMWQEALAHLDEAAAKGASLPQGLRDAVEGRQQAKVREEEEIRTQAAQRDKSEIRNLRAEAKRLRAENTDLEANVEELQRRVKSWSVATALVSGVALALLGGVMIFGGPDEAPTTALAAGPLAPPSPPSPRAPRPLPPSPSRCPPPSAAAPAPRR
jgi:tetratricopeptide (TPR) repeat protein